MTLRTLTYAAVTPARNEAVNLVRLTECLVGQTVRPSVWTIVDNGSTDGTPELVRELAAEHPWIRLLQIPAEARAARGAPSVRAFHAGLAALASIPDVVVNIDADVSVEGDHFERLLRAFADDPALGIASGSAYEWEADRWRQRFTTRTSVWGAVRAWRRECLQQVLPLEERVGWDGIDECKANARGWTTETLVSLPFFHHRPEGAIDGSSWEVWRAQGELAHFLDYRPLYLVFRTLYRATRTPAAFALLFGYAGALLRREARCSDRAAREYLRRQQTLRALPQRLLEARGRTVGIRVA